MLVLNYVSFAVLTVLLYIAVRSTSILPDLSPFNNVYSGKLLLNFEVRELFVF